MTCWLKLSTESEMTFSVIVQATKNYLFFWGMEAYSLLKVLLC